MDKKLELKNLNLQVREPNLLKNFINEVFDISNKYNLLDYNDKCKFILDLQKLQKSYFNFSTYNCTENFIHIKIHVNYLTDEILASTIFEYLESLKMLKFILNLF